ncbi:HAD-like protein [Nemania sp. FL0916]|nr:HAD-like protein [Nemania sp. FL0916]
MESSRAPPRGVIFDLGDVLFTWSAETSTNIPARQLRAILNTRTWYSYERGEITRATCYERVAEQFFIPAGEVAKAFTGAHESLRPNQEIVSLLRGLKKNRSIRIYAMSNIGKEDFEELATLMDWSLFDQVFTSGAAGMRKPELGFYRYVLDQTGLEANQLIFIDDKAENVTAAEDSGIRGLIFGDSTIHLICRMFDDPVGKGWMYLFQNAKQCLSVTSDGVSFGDNFAQLLVLDLLGDNNLTELRWEPRKTWNFFSGKTALNPEDGFPDDLDTTSLALQVFRSAASDVASLILDNMAQYVNENGTFQTYFSIKKDRVDPIVSANILACFYSYGRGHEFEQTLRLIQSMLLDRSYSQGTRYYPSPDCCLGFIGRLLRSSDDLCLQSALGPLLASRLRERLGLGGSALDLAMRVSACAQLGIPCEQDRQCLLKLQCDDGSWEPGWMYQFGSRGMKIGNRSVTTAMAVVALSSEGTATVT